ncbi:hypothetical protein VSR68_26785 [Paraburkholderia phymatum]
MTRNQPVELATLSLQARVSGFRALNDATAFRALRVQSTNPFAIE